MVNISSEVDCNNWVEILGCFLNLYVDKIAKNPMNYLKKLKNIPTAQALL